MKQTVKPISCIKMKDKRVSSKPFKDESIKNIIRKFQINFENINSTKIASAILVLFLIKLRESHGDITKDNIVESSSVLKILKSGGFGFERHEDKTYSDRNEPMKMDINRKDDKCFEYKQNELMSNGSEPGENFKFNSATEGVNLVFNKSDIKQDNFIKFKVYYNNDYLDKQKNINVTQKDENCSIIEIGNVVKNKKNNPDLKLVTAKSKSKAANSLSSLLIKPADSQLYNNRSRGLHVTQELDPSRVQFTLSKELLMTENTGKIRTTFKIKHVRLPRKISPIMLSTNSKFEYYSQNLNYTSMDRKLKNDLKLKMRKKPTFRQTGKYNENKKAKKSQKITERALNTTYQSVNLKTKRDKAMNKSTGMKGKHQNKNRINRTNYIKALRKQIKADILKNTHHYALVPRYNDPTLGATMLKDIIKKMKMSTGITPDRLNSSRINLKSSTSRLIVTTHKSKNDYYATLGRELINDYFSKQKQTTVSLTLKVPDKNDDDDDEDDLEGAYAYILYRVVYNPMSAYNNYRTNFSNDFYKYTHAITSWNNINNIIAIHLRTRPPSGKTRVTCFFGCKLQTMLDNCPTKKRPVRIIMEEFALPQKTVFEMVWMGVLFVIFALFCCGTPIVLLDQVKKKKVPPCCDQS